MRQQQHASPPSASGAPRKGDALLWTKVDSGGRYTDFGDKRRWRASSIDLPLVDVDHPIIGRVRVWS